MRRFVLFLLPVACSTSPTTSTGDCETGSDCVGREWLGECPEVAGTWSCSQGDCVGTCDPAACWRASDCSARDWPADGACTADTGRWECRTGLCEPACPTECLVGDACIGRAWSNAGCLEADGHWECDAGFCVAVCDTPECGVPGDCNGLPWPAIGCGAANGFWECNAGGNCVAHCDPPECESWSDCTGKPWPANAGCAEQDGFWHCAGGCVPICSQPECTEPDDCSGNAWPGDAGCLEADGHWECNGGDCDAVCGAGCTVPSDCHGETWPGTAACLSQFGYWACNSGQCIPTCPLPNCPNGNCVADEGETETTCPTDCRLTCQTPDHCVERNWNQLCQGYWTCFLGDCNASCDLVDRCGNGTCDVALGESGDSCFTDCQGGPCTDTLDCLHRYWWESCGGHWSCNGAGGCAAVCDASGCGDATCDPNAGETPDTCADDCSGYGCTDNSSCSGLTLPDGCDGSWICIGSVCVPYCGQ